MIPLPLAGEPLEQLLGNLTLLDLQAKPLSSELNTPLKHAYVDGYKESADVGLTCLAAWWLPA